MDTAAPANIPPSNIPEYTVSEISGAVKRTLEGAFGRIRVRGEITDYKRYPSGHMYFSLKDEGGKISGVVWKGAVSKLGLVPENGVEVIATGKVSAYGDRSSYQLVVERMEYAGAGALLARIEMLRVRLAEEGLFDAARKRPIPLLPAVVGVVTSAAGAVLHDIRTTIARRFPRPLLIWPVPVQGEDAAARIAAAIDGFDAIEPGGPIPRPDVIIVARGGGSLEDLMAFNEEVVLRAVARCRIPLISAVGHETDHTLIDLASDRRAPTPTAAAEMAVPSRVELVANLAQESARLVNSLARMTQERRMRLGHAAQGLPNLPNLVDAARQRLDDRTQRLDIALPNLLVARRAALARAERGMPDLPAMVRAARQAMAAHTHRLALALPNLVARRRSALVAIRLPAPNTVLSPPAASLRLVAVGLGHALQRAAARHRDTQTRIAARLSPAPLLSGLREARTRLDSAAARLESVSHAAVLARGYAVVLDSAGHAVTRAAAVRPGARLALRFADGDTPVTADGYAKPTQTKLAL
jgi:exodeoxyribonuclease VII large subunit